jgi:hypothetical protein
MENYGGRGTHLYTLMEILRGASLENKLRDVPNDTLHGARAELSGTMNCLDHSMHCFSQYLNKLALGKCKTRLVMVIEGSFGAGEEEGLFETMLAVDVGTNPFSLFQRPRNSAVDMYITQEKTLKYLRLHKKELQKEGFEYFDVIASKFFYFREGDLKEGGLIKKGDVDLEELIPFISYTPHVGLRKAEVPSLQEYQKMSIELTNYRLKSPDVIIGKIIDKLLLPLGSEYFRPILDLAAHRIVTSTEGRVFELVGRLCADEKVRGKVERNYYDNPKENGYKAVHMSSKWGHCIREIQIVDLGQYYRNEVNPSDSASHHQQKKKQAHTSRKRRELERWLKEKLEKVCSSEGMRLYI